MSNNLKFKLFNTLIRPILTYGAEIWVSDYNSKNKTQDTFWVYIKRHQIWLLDLNSVDDQ